ncbi:ABC transporter permease [Larsenimonas rhizosphaerae]|uniref:Transport permease protein n=1 Tax=Larsenimonas rhizosphaerae TaxID=2944682 RepID=A0AA42CUF5_9GAMM|nr:ABC transporter permease [Larsenimonas rhizosphaerae]MCM2132029.1 ABC transporter permease [Larsenimonas rhizosphaerae]MCX2524632.1 ABC transporter permease [Larsenimonas rhizosphaerae]
MSQRQLLIALWTIVTKEVRRFMRIWPQTLLPPSITMTMYFIIFGNLIGQRVGEMDGVPYIDYIVPGLIMMSVITNSYSNVASSFFSNKFQRSVEEMVVSPMPDWIILLGFVIGGVARGLAVGAIVTAVSLFFTDVQVHHPLLTVLVVVLTAVLFSIGGFINSLLAKKFDDISIVPIFVLTPLTYLGGVFYSIHMLPDFWQMVSMINPILYMVNTFRYGILGVSDISAGGAMVAIVAFIVVLYALALWLLKRGQGIRS